MLVRALRIFSEALSLARSGGNARLELETALLRFIVAGEDPTLDGTARTPSGARGTSSAPRRRPRPASAPLRDKPAPSRETARPFDRSLAAKGASGVGEHPLRRSRASGSRCAHRSRVPRSNRSTSNAVVLKLPEGWIADALRDHAALIEAAIADVLGSPLRVTLRVDAPGRAKPEAGALGPSPAPNRRMPTRSSTTPTNGYDKE